MHPLMLLALAAAWVAAMVVGFAVVFPVLFAVTLVVAGFGAAGLSYAQAVRALTPSSREGPSPVPEPAVAYRHYLLGQIWRDWWAIARAVGPRVWTLAREVLVRLTGVLLLGGPWGFFLFPVWLGLCAGIVVAAVPAALLALALTVLYGAVAAAGLAGWLVCAGVLWAVERVFTVYGRILQTCPHPFCYERIGLPVYACPGCGARHGRLVPGTAGAFRHVCRCGARLPTTVLLGRFRLAAYCPHCAGRLPPRIGRVRVEPLPFVGGPGAGKTTFMVLGIRALHGRARAVRGRVAFVEARHAAAYAGTVRAFRSGGRPAKTGPELPLATMLDVELPGRARRILYLFDPAGEHFTGAPEVESLRYLDHGEALLFIVDPFALPHVRRSLSDAERARAEAAAGPSGEDPADTLQRVLNELRSRPDRGRQKRVAVVITKTDLLLGTEVGRRLYADPDLREWLRSVGLGNTVRTLDQIAAEVRYFGSGLTTDPAYVADLLGWAAGLSPAEPSDAPAALDAADEIPGTAPLRAPWPVRGRDAALVPAGYQVGRWTVLAGTSVLTLAALTATAAEITTRLPF
ncbi:TRAFAC clade GTPase domain-containing protein [Actinomadura atramentaria]|uniref:TRAFAC clade GTPase domain-containing protein n=1 Tax=Actinomadura atramentaria TaxID=1990 RepID=UPI000381FCA3|nr:hypothetical protein [Actinomadura atramentaria]